MTSYEKNLGSVDVRGSTSVVLHDRYVTFRYVDGGSETYVLQDLVRALAKFAGIECEKAAS